MLKPIPLSYYEERMQLAIKINAKLSASQEFALNYEEKMPEYRQVPPEYHEYMDVFREEKADQFSESVLYSAPPSPQGLRGQSEQSAESENSPSGVRAFRSESEDTPRTVRKYPK